MDKSMKRKPRGLQDAAQSISYEDRIIGGATFRARVTAHEQAGVPKPRPYVFDSAQCEEIAIAVRRNMNVLLTGPTGCGKTSVIGALAAMTNMPLVRFNCDGETRVSNLRGMMKPTSQDGVLSLIFSPGDLAVAMEQGWWVLLDEIDAALPSVLFVLQPVFEEDRRELHVPELKKTITAHPDFRIFATGNTIGFRASARARHAGTNPMNAAFVDRFGVVIACDYPSKDVERERIRVNVPELDFDFAEGIARVADALRKDQKFKADFSTRRCVQWARLIHDLDNDVLRAADLAVLRKLESPTDASVARSVIRRIFGYEEEK
jgi:cobaltochelatase CobS